MLYRQIFRDSWDQEPCPTLTEEDLFHVEIQLRRLTKRTGDLS